MYSTPEQQENFIYKFSFESQEERGLWSFFMGNESGNPSRYDNLLFSGSVSGDFNRSYSLKQNNSILAIGDPDQGIVDIYENEFYSINESNEFNKVNKIYGASPGTVSGFGKSISLLGDQILIGAPFSNDNSGSCYLHADFENNTSGATGLTEWNQLAYLEGQYPSGHFGAHVSTSETNGNFTFAISATGENNQSGAVYLYKDEINKLVKKIEPSEAGIKKFGRSTCFAKAEDVRYLIISYEKNGTGEIGMYKESIPGSGDFSKYRSIQSENPHSGDFFGYSIDSSQDYFAVSAPNENQSGSVYYYKYDNNSGLFIKKQKFQPDDLQESDAFGKNISFHNQDAIITSNNSSGKGYIYYKENNNWEEVAQITGTNNTQSGSFGGNLDGSHNTCIYDELIIVGSSDESTNYIYSTGEDNYDSTIFFGFSGYSGKFYDNDSNFLFGYSPGQRNEISGSVFPDHFNLFINNYLFNSKISRQSGTINGWDISGTENLTHYSLELINSTN